MSNQCAVIGHPVAHSLSPMIHHFFARQTNVPLMYGTIQGDDECVEQQINTFFAAGGLGLNVTLPFKKRAYYLAHIHSLRSEQAQAANTLWMHNQKIYSDNTDGVGLVRDLSRYLTLADKRILILGAGGAAQGIIHPLLAMGLRQLSVANRSWGPLAALQYRISNITCLEDWSQVSESFDVIINATSADILGMRLQLPAFLFASHPFCYDLAYNVNEETSFVRYTRKKGCCAVDGLGMLIEQAAESFFLWHGIRPETKLLARDYFKFP